MAVRDRGTLKRLAALEGYTQHLADTAVGIVLLMQGYPAKFEQETFVEGQVVRRL